MLYDLRWTVCIFGVSRTCFTGVTGVTSVTTFDCNYFKRFGKLRACMRVRTR